MRISPRWEYEESIPELRNYLRLPLAPRSLLLGRTNLAFAQVECRQHAEAFELLSENILMAQDQKHLHLECFNHALRAQVFIHEGDYSGAKDELKIARGQTSQAQTNDQFFVTKLELICEGLAQQDLAPFAQLRDMAMTKRDSFALRDADFFALKVKFDKAKYLHLYFPALLPAPPRTHRSGVRRATGPSYLYTR